jgi:outer membrane lipoprotein-sorting protein
MYAFALVLSVAPGFPFPPSDAERLMREMDAAITAARTLHIDFEIRNDKPGKGERLFRGSVYLADHNRFRYDQTGTLTASVISDGHHTVTTVVNPAERVSQETPGWFNEVLQTWLGRGGTYVSVGRVCELAARRPGETPGREDGPRVSNARLLPDEVVGGVKARVVEYDLGWEKLLSVVDAAKVRVWIDPKTKLPIRRTFVIRPGATKDTYTATHKKFEIDPKLDPKLFELPK